MYLSVCAIGSRQCNRQSLSADIFRVQVTPGESRATWSPHRHAQGAPLRALEEVPKNEALKNYCAAQLAASAPLLYAHTGPVLGAHLQNELGLLATFFRAP